MTLQWTAVALFLYAEIGFILLLLLPWIRPPTWSKFFKSRFVRSIEKYSYIYTYALGGILALLFLDAIRETRKYAAADKDMDLSHVSGNADALVHMRLFRAQRNLYISGFALFLSLVIRRMTTLVVNEARLMAALDAALKQAVGASAAAQQLIGQDPQKGKEAVAAIQDEAKLKETIAELRQKVKAAEADRDAMKDQADALKREYDTLLDEHGQLEKVLKRTSDVHKKD